MLLFSCGLFAQPNCEAYKYQGDELKYRACKVAEKRAGHYQFSRAYQEALDEALAIDSTFAYAYRVKSTAYLKSGDFITWKKLIDQAVKYDPEGELFYRASCRYQFFRDYRGAIADVDLLDSLVDYDIGYSQNGDYHLNIIKALSYKGLGMPDKALEIFTRHIGDSTYFAGIYDYLHLGVLYIEMGDYEKAVEAFKRQELENDIAENRYYIALTYKALDQRVEYLANLNLAKEKYEARERMFDPYVEKMDEIFLSDILNEINSAENQQ
jgi:tetratricopeptide (TPR) repeat protein